MKIAIGGDHAGFEYKAKLINFLKADHQVKDFGPSTDDSVDYPDHVHPLATAVGNEEQDLGILICGSANGVAITANKHQKIRAAIAWEEELASLAREHNNANVICLPARFVSYEKAESIIKAFLEAKFEGGRHERRVNKIPC
ncbi:ribose 5-phosphate isomerase B [Marivirga atlantica]|jgi:ribose 5-phosphate isomerase B|uniref:Ribose 5-phosphate isomerase B n=1 Tax=Marivirga atlantica TaxID=1548457 RepID=A0A937DI80_9BACT|nr:ribose 5-phosphate isomerase B [Marivirga atlantica]MBL0763881.1 ribose 5-phosphate isomerase B [Marivirga atlantica]